MILALDPGGCTGWARSDGACGTLDYRKLLWGQASVLFSAWLADQIDLGVKRIAYEMPFVRHQSTAMAFGLVWDALRIAHVHELPVPLSIAPAIKYRSLDLNVRRATRQQRAQALREHIDTLQRWRIRTQHEADAAAVLLAAEAALKEEAHTC